MFPEHFPILEFLVDSVSFLFPINSILSPDIESWFCFLELGTLVDKGNRLQMRKEGKLNSRRMLIIYTNISIKKVSL